MYDYIFSTKVLYFYDNSASRQFCSRRSSRHVACIIQIHMPCRLLVLHAPLYTNIVDRKSGPFGENLDKNAKNWLEQGALAIFWRFLTPGNKWCLDWSWFQTIYPIPIFDILFPFPVTKSQSQWLKSHFPRAKNRPIPVPILPLQDPHILACVMSREFTREAVTKFLPAQFRWIWCKYLLTNIIYSKIFNLT